MLVTVGLFKIEKLKIIRIILGNKKNRPLLKKPRKSLSTQYHNVNS